MRWGNGAVLVWGLRWWGGRWLRECVNVIIKKIKDMACEIRRDGDRDRGSRWRKYC